MAQGFLLTAVTTLGGSELSDDVEDAIVAFISQSSRFLKPVFIGDTIHVELKVSELIPKKNNGIIKFRTVIKNQNNDVALEGEHVYLINKRAPQERSK